MELPYHLKILPPDALDVLRFFSSRTSPADVGDICDGCGLTDRGASKVIKRLVTKGYIQMGADRSYTLTNLGTRSIGELAEYDLAHPPGSERKREEPRIIRRMVMVTPRVFASATGARVMLGFNEAEEDDGYLLEPADVIARISVVNGDMTPRELTFSLGNRAAHQSFQVVAGQSNRVRVRVEVFQLTPDEDVERVGGMYVDADVAPDENSAASDWTAFGTNIAFTQTG